MPWLLNKLDAIFIMKIILVLTLVVFSVSFSTAQKRFDVFKVAGNNNFLPSAVGETSKDYQRSVTANLSIPIVLKDSSILFTSVDYQFFDVDNEYSLSSPVERFNIHGIILRTGYIRKLSSKTALQILFVPRYMTDFNASFSNSLQLGGIVMYEKVKSVNLTWRAGVLYNQENFGPYIIPIVYLDWKITNKIRFKGLLPVYGKLYTEHSSKFSSGIHFVGLTTTYGTNEISTPNLYVDRRSIDLSYFWNVNLFGNIFLEGRAGYSLSKDYGLYAKGDKMTLGLPLVNIGDDRVRLNEKSKGSPFVHFRLIYSLPIK